MAGYPEYELRYIMKVRDISALEDGVNYWTHTWIFPRFWKGHEDKGVRELVHYHSQLNGNVNSPTVKSVTKARFHEHVCYIAETDTQQFAFIQSDMTDV